VRSIGSLESGLWCQLLTSEVPGQTRCCAKGCHVVCCLSCVVSDSEAKMKSHEWWLGGVLK
jgi:hypothetical protein